VPSPPTLAAAALAEARQLLPSWPVWHDRFAALDD
jgi:hypothetical protein